MDEAIKKDDKISRAKQLAVKKKQVVDNYDELQQELTSIDEEKYNEV